MTKDQWLRHWNHAKNDPGHDVKSCPECQSRLKTKRHNASAKARRDIYNSLGMKRVRGLLGGIYYE